jgi:hypothetical protein
MKPDSIPFLIAEYSALAVVFLLASAPVIFAGFVLYSVNLSR